MNLSIQPCGDLNFADAFGPICLGIYSDFSPLLCLTPPNKQLLYRAFSQEVTQEVPLSRCSPRLIWGPYHFSLRGSDLELGVEDSELFHDLFVIYCFALFSVYTQKKKKNVPPMKKWFYLLISCKENFYLHDFSQLYYFWFQLSALSLNTKSSLFRQQLSLQ